MFHFVNCTSSPAPGAESSEESFLAMSQSAPSSWRNTLGVSCYSDNETGSCPGSPSGMMYAPSMANPGEAMSMSSVEAFPARTSAQPGRAPESTGSAAASGLSLQGSLARWDHDSSSWRTPQCSLVEGLDEFSETWPRWGSMRNGVSWARTMPALPTFGNESGFWPTPGAAKANNDVNLTCSGDGRAKPNKLGWAVAESLWPTPTVNWNYNKKGSSPKAGDGLATAVMMWPTPTAVTDTGGAALCKWGGSGARAKLRTMVTPEELNGSLNPQWVAWLMGWPTEWTSLEPLGTDKFQAWLLWHSPRSIAA